MMAIPVGRLSGILPFGGQFLWSSGAQYMLLNSTVGCEEALPRENFQGAVVFLWGERGACHSASLCSNLICNSEELWNTSVTLTVVPGMLLLSSHFLQHQSWSPPGNIYFCMSSWRESCFYHDQDPIVPRGNELISTHRSPMSTDALSSVISVSPYTHLSFVLVVGDMRVCFHCMLLGPWLCCFYFPFLLVGGTHRCSAVTASSPASFLHIPHVSDQPVFGFLCLTYSLGMAPSSSMWQQNAQVHLL